MKVTSISPNQSSTRSRRASRVHHTGALLAGSAGHSAGGKRRQRESVQDSVYGEMAEVAELNGIIEVSDEMHRELQGLRFSEAEQEVGGLHADVEFPTKTVGVRRLLNIIEDEKDEPPKPYPMLHDLPDEHLEVYSPATSLQKKKVEALHFQLDKENRIQAALRERSLNAQEASLASWDRALGEWDSTRRKVGETVGFPTDSLVIAQPMPLPSIQNHRGTSLGPENDFPQIKHKERFYQKDAFHALPERIGPPEDELIMSMTWLQRKFYKPPVSMVRPNLGEQPQGQVDAQTRRCKLHARDKDEENLAHLWVKGTRIEPEQEEEEENNEMSEEDTLWNLESSLSTYRRASLISHRQAQSIGGPVSVCKNEHYVRHPVPAFKLDRFIYIWGQPSLQGLVEIGVVSNAGKQGLTHILLANVGCCVMRYSWRRKPHTDHFNTGRYRHSPFTFNFNNGCLLPEEKLSIPVKFRSPYPGCWTELWMLQTVPRVYTKNIWGGGTSEIEVSLWGQALEVDVNLARRQQMDRELDHSAVLRMSERLVLDLIRFLPIRSHEERAREELRRQQVFDAVSAVPWGLSCHSSTLLAQATGTEADTIATFNRLNPTLHYHSAVMAQVVMAHCDMEQLQTDPSNQSQQGQRAALQRSDSDPSATCELARSSSSLRFPLNVAPVQKVTQRQRKLTMTFPRRRKTLIVKRERSGTIASLLDSGLRQLRQKVCLGSVIREAYKTLSEDSLKKEEVLCKVNQAMLQMSTRPFTPHMRHYKHLMARAALAQLMDSIALNERRLRRTLGLQDDHRFLKLASFPEDANRFSRENQKRRLLPQAAQSPSGRQRRMTLAAGMPRIKEMTSVEDDKSAEAVDWQEPLAVQYKRKLWALVHGLLESCLCDLYVVVTAEGLSLNPFQPRPEI